VRWSTGERDDARTQYTLPTDGRVRGHFAPTRRLRGAWRFSACGEHMERLLRSCKILMIDVPYTLDQLCDAAVETVRVNEMNDGCYIRPSSTSVTARWA